MISDIPVSCNRDCGGSCALLARVEDGRVTRLVDNPAGGPYMQGCVRGYQMARVLYSPERLLKPLVRSGPRGSGQFREAGWGEALDLVARRLAAIRDDHGAESILHLGGSGSCRGALHHTGTLTARFLTMFGGCTRTDGNYSSQAVSFVLPYVLGTRQAGLDAATLQDSQLIILWGANVADCRMGGETYRRILEAKRRGAAVIVVDPRRSATVTQLATAWLPVWPGTDSALMLAVLYVLFTHNLAERGFLARYAVGADELECHVLGLTDGRPKTPAWAAALCGTPVEQIEAFALLYGQTRPAALIPGLSIQRTLGGEDTSRLAITLQTVTGNLGVRGGSSGAAGPGGLPGPAMGSMPIPAHTRLPSVPVYRWPDAILEGTRGGSALGGLVTDIRAIYNVGGNYLMQGSDVHKNIRAFEAIEFAVTHDSFLTPTARYCDVVLPTTTFLERQDIVFAAGNYVFFSNQASAPLGEARNDYDIFCGLADRLGFGLTYSEGKDEDAWLRSFVAASDVPDYEEFRRTGIHFGEHQPRTAFADFVAAPGLIPLGTTSGQVELLSSAYAAATGFPALPTAQVLPTNDDTPLRLITPKSKFRVHSQHGNIAWFNEHEPAALWIHPQDAAARGIVAGEAVLITNPQGVVRVPARVTNDITPGVVCLLEGVWPVFAAGGVESAGSPNVLTSTEPTLPSQGSRTHSILVQVAPA